MSETSRSRRRSARPPSTSPRRGSPSRPRRRRAPTPTSSSGRGAPASATRRGRSRPRSSRRGAGPRRRATARPRLALAASGPRVADPTRHPAPRRGGSRAGDQGRGVPAVRGRAPGVRDRGGRGDGGREPERAPEDPRGAARVRPPASAELRAGDAARDGDLALPAGSIRPASPARRRGAARERVLEAPEAERRAAARLCGGDAERALFLLTNSGRELRSAPKRARGPRAPTASATRRGWRCSTRRSGPGRRPRPRPRRGSPNARRCFAASAGAEAASPRRRAGARDGAGGSRCLTWGWPSARRGSATSPRPARAPPSWRSTRTGSRAARRRRGARPAGGARAAELVLDTQRLRVHVSEELALEALFYRAAAVSLSRSSVTRDRAMCLSIARFVLLRDTHGACAPPVGWTGTSPSSCRRQAVARARVRLRGDRHGRVGVRVRQRVERGIRRRSAPSRSPSGAP